MGYLITHIAVWLVFAQLLGLLLGWLIWGYVAQQRGLEISSLRERVADMQLAQQRTSVAMGPKIALAEARAGLLIDDDLTNQEEGVRGPFLKSVEDRPARSTAKIANGSAIGSATLDEEPPEGDDDDRAKKHDRTQELERRMRELESVRDRLPLLQADLSDAISAKRVAETKLQEAKSEFEARSKGLLTQIRDFENAAAGWNRMRAELEESSLEKEKELALVKAHLRDLQNSQRPQSADASAGQVTVLMQELAELRDKHSKTSRERDALAHQLEARRISESARSNDTSRLTGRTAELEEMLREKEATIAEQLTRIETLLWREAELQPFAVAAPKLEEQLRRQESEIAGHIAMHEDSGNKIRALQIRIGELEKDVENSREIERQLTARQFDIQRLIQEREDTLTTFRLTLAQRDELVAEKAADVTRHLRTISELQGQVAGLERTVQRMEALENSLTEREAEVRRLIDTHEQERREWQGTLAKRDALIGEHIAAREQQTTALADLQGQIGDLDRRLDNREREHAALMDQHAGLQAAHQGLKTAHGELQSELQRWKVRTGELEPKANRVPVLERMLNERDAEIAWLKDLQHERDAQIKTLQERLNMMATRLAIQQQQLEELEPLAARAPMVEQQLASLEQRHQSELTRLKVNSAQRIRRLRQSITTFRG